MRMSYNQYQAVFFASRSIFAKNWPGDEARYSLNEPKKVIISGTHSALTIKLISKVMKALKKVQIYYQPECRLLVGSEKTRLMDQFEKCKSH